MEENEHLKTGLCFPPHCEIIRIILPQRNMPLKYLVLSHGNSNLSSQSCLFSINNTIFDVQIVQLGMV